MATAPASKKMKSIPQELMFEIFSWLPIKSLMRYRCAYKFYNSLVFESNFVDIHHLRSMTRPGGRKYLVYKDNTFYDTEMKEDGKASLVRIGNSCVTYSGLMCVDGLVCSLNDKKHIAIYDFNTREQKFLQTPKEFVKRESYGVCSIGFEPEEKEYKLWLILHLSSERCTTNWVLTLNDLNKSWRKIKSKVRFRPSMCRVCASGAIYMLINTHCQYSQTGIIAFDVRAETLKIFRLPDVFYRDGNTFNQFIELKGKLAVLNYRLYSNEDQHLWILREAQNEYNWESYIIQVPSQLKDINFMCTSYDKEIVFSSTITESSDSIYMCYDFTRKSWREFGEIEKLGDRFYIDNIFCYVENLFSLRKLLDY